jgi:integrase
MTDYLTKRNGHWHFVRRVPTEFAHLDKRDIINHTTRILVARDRRGLKAGRIADTMNRELEAYWRGLLEGRAQEAADRYTEARRRARTLGFDYAEVGELIGRSLEERVARVETLITKRLIDDYGANAALLGGEQRPPVKLSEVFPIFEKTTTNAVKDMSPNQLKRWKNGYSLAVNDLISVVGDKNLGDLRNTDILDYVDWLEGRVSEEEIVAKTANKYIGHNSKMIKSINRRLRLGLPEFFAGMRLQGVQQISRPPFPIDFVQEKLLAEGALMGLNDEARRAILLIADTGLRLSEAVNLNETTIHLDCTIPYVEVLPDGRRVKTQDSIRQIPLVGTALAAMKLHPGGFPRYMDKGASFSGYVNGYLLDQGLRPTRKHTVYSLRHTFKDRLIAAKCQDSMIEALMGHSDDHPKYGSGPALDLKFEVLHRIAFTPPSIL